MENKKKQSMILKSEQELNQATQYLKFLKPENNVKRITAFGESSKMNGMLSERDINISSFQNSYSTLDIFKKNYCDNQDRLSHGSARGDQKVSNQQEIIESSINQVNKVYSKNHIEFMECLSSIQESNQIPSSLDSTSRTNYNMSLANTLNQIDLQNKNPKKRLNSEGSTQRNTENSYCSSNSNSKIQINTNYLNDFNQMSNNNNNQILNKTPIKQVEISTPERRPSKSKCTPPRPPKNEPLLSTSKWGIIQKITKNSCAYSNPLSSRDSNKLAEISNNDNNIGLSNYTTNTNIQPSIGNFQNHSHISSTNFCSVDENHHYKTQILSDDRRFIMNHANNDNGYDYNKSYTMTKLDATPCQESSRREISYTSVTPLRQYSNDISNIGNGENYSVDSPSSTSRYSLPYQKFNVYNEDNSIKNENCLSDMYRFNNVKNTQRIHEINHINEDQISNKKLQIQEGQEKEGEYIAMIKNPKQILMEKSEIYLKELGKNIPRANPLHDSTNCNEQTSLSIRDHSIHSITTTKPTLPNEKFANSGNKNLKDKENFTRMISMKPKINANIYSTPQKSTTLKISNTNANIIKPLDCNNTKSPIKKTMNTNLNAINDIKHPHCVVTFGPGNEIIKGSKPTVIKNTNMDKAEKEWLKLNQNKNSKKTMDKSTPHKEIKQVNAMISGTANKLPRSSVKYQGICTISKAKIDNYSQSHSKTGREIISRGHCVESDRKYKMMLNPKLKSTSIIVSPFQNLKKSTINITKNLTPTKKYQQGTSTSPLLLNSNHDEDDIKHRNKVKSKTYLESLKDQSPINSERKSLNPIDKLYSDICDQLAKEMINLAQNQNSNSSHHHHHMSANHGKSNVYA